jgi:hypothetical protein
LGFVLDAPLLVVFVAAVMVIGTIWPEAGLLKRISATCCARPGSSARMSPG